MHPFRLGIVLLGAFAACAGCGIFEGARPKPAAPALVQPPPPASPKPADAPLPAPLTPPAPDAPRVTGARIFGVRPASPFLYSIPATGREPLTYAADHLPAGLTLDPATGQISGSLAQPGVYRVVLRARNDLGSSEIPFRIVVGEDIALTPPMGWNSWNCWAGAVDQDKVLRSARAMVASGLNRHGWVYINIDDTWQGARQGPDHALLANDKFPDMKALCDGIHALGLKAGIYSTPWTTSYAGYAGGSSDDPSGAWTKPNISREEKRRIINKKIMPWAIGKYHFMRADARQWAAWGFDYLKYDWNPIEPDDVQEMETALRASGRDLVFSLSNSAPFEHVRDYVWLANCWRTSGDIRDNWASLSKNGFREERWAPFARPGRWNDPDMLVVGYVGWGPKLHRANLTADEQYTHISLWCLLSAPLLIGCDLERLDAFTLGLLSNDEVLAVDQDELGLQARRVAAHADVEAYAKPLADGSWAVGLFNRGETPAPARFSWSELGLAGGQTARDLWRQKDLGTFPDHFETEIAPHGAFLMRVAAARP